jgi:DNA topoisomerase-1
VKTTKVKTTQFEAHEAIRITDINLKELPENMDIKERKMYKLIWINTLESCMVTASYNSIHSHITGPNDTKYNYSTDLICFPGWKIVENKFSRENKEFTYLQTIANNSIIPFKKIKSKLTLKGQKIHYSEAKLVQLLEERGIGRPSTFSSLIDKIQQRGYVKKENVQGIEIICKEFELENDIISEMETKREFGNEKNKLIIQPLGIIVIEILNKYFNPLFNYDYSSSMEEFLDNIAKGNACWTDICSLCNKEVDGLIEGVKDETKIEYKIDDNNTFTIGKYGPVIKCVDNETNSVSFKSIKKDVDLKKIKKGEYDSINDIIDSTNNKIILGKYEENEMTLQKGKFGLYIKWGNNTRNLKELGNKHIDDITFDECIKLIENKETNSNLIREINDNMSIRKGPKGDYLFYKNKKMKKPTFHDIKIFMEETKETYTTCDINILKSWIKEKYNMI